MKSPTDPRAEAWRRYARAYETWAERRQVYHAEGRVVEAEGVLAYATLIRRALDAELVDPEPMEACECDACIAFVADQWRAS